MNDVLIDKKRVEEGYFIWLFNQKWQEEREAKLKARRALLKLPQVGNGAVTCG